MIIMNVKRWSSQVWKHDHESFNGYVQSYPQGSFFEAQFYRSKWSNEAYLVWKDDQVFVFVVLIYDGCWFYNRYHSLLWFGFVGIELKIHLLIRSYYIEFWAYYYGKMIKSVLVYFNLPLFLLLNNKYAYSNDEFCQLNPYWIYILRKLSPIYHASVFSFDWSEIYLFILIIFPSPLDLLPL